MRRYIQSYFNKNYSNVKFKIIDNSFFYLTGDQDEYVNIYYVVITTPKSKGEECPEILQNENKVFLYCQGFFTFNFQNEKMFAE
jgi:hypothetical protein